MGHRRIGGAVFHPPPRADRHAGYASPRQATGTRSGCRPAAARIERPCGGYRASLGCWCHNRSVVTPAPSPAFPKLCRCQNLASAAIGQHHSLELSSGREGSSALASGVSDGGRNALPFCARPRATSTMRSVLRTWRDDYNHVRPHSGIGGLTPADAAKRVAQPDPSGHPGNPGLYL